MPKLKCSKQKIQINPTVWICALIVCHIQHSFVPHDYPSLFADEVFLFLLTSFSCAFRHSSLNQIPMTQNAIQIPTPCLRNKIQNRCQSSQSCMNQMKSISSVSLFSPCGIFSVVFFLGIQRRNLLQIVSFSLVKKILLHIGNRRVIIVIPQKVAN